MGRPRLTGPASVNPNPGGGFDAAPRAEPQVDETSPRAAWN
jgi:hypothetical protein